MDIQAADRRKSASESIQSSWYKRHQPRTGKESHNGSGTGHKVAVPSAPQVCGGQLPGTVQDALLDMIIQQYIVHVGVCQTRYPAQQSQG